MTDAEPPEDDAVGPGNDVWVNSRSNLRAVTQTDRIGERRGGVGRDGVMELYRPRAVKHIDR